MKHSSIVASFFLVTANTCSCFQQRSTSPIIQNANIDYHSKLSDSIHPGESSHSAFVGKFEKRVLHRGTTTTFLQALRRRDALITYSNGVTRMTKYRNYEKSFPSALQSSRSPHESLHRIYEYESVFPPSPLEESIRIEPHLMENTTPTHYENHPNHDTSHQNEPYMSMIDDVSDEEVILACRAYLQKKNRLGGWTDYNKRKEQASRSLALARVPSISDSRRKTKKSKKTSSNITARSRTSKSSVKKKRRVRRKGSKIQKRRKKDTRLADHYVNLGVGYFWEDPNELRYLRKGRLLDEQYHVLSSEIELEEGQLQASNRKQQWVEEIDEEEEEAYQQNISPRLKDDEERGGEFTTFPVNPSELHLKRSRIRKAFFNDPVWKAQWYEKRWGKTMTSTDDQAPSRSDSKRSKMRTPQEKKQQRREALLQKIPSDMLNSPEFVSLSDDEIEQAVKTYITANAKRSESLKRGRKVRDGIRQIRLKDVTNALKQNEYQSKPLENNEIRKEEPFFISSTEALKEAQKKRSDKAAKAYKTRLVNQEKRRRKRFQSKTYLKTLSLTEASNSTIQPPYSKDTAISDICPIQALDHVETALQSNYLPSVMDMKIILEPKRLRKRKEVLTKILSKCFQLRGKCIPDVTLPSASSSSFDLKEYKALIEEANDKKFVTKSTVQEIGYYCLFLISSKTVT